jgi:excisionase family DNA binding protein
MAKKATGVFEMEGNMFLGEQPTLLLRVDEVAAQLRLHPSRIFPILKSGSLRSIRIGKSRRVLQSDLVAYVNRLAAEQNSDAELSA